MDVIKLIPPLVIQPDDVDEIADAFEATIAACHRFPGPVWEVAKRLTQQAKKRLSRSTPLAAAPVGDRA